MNRIVAAFALSSYLFHCRRVTQLFFGPSPIKNAKPLTRIQHLLSLNRGSISARWADALRELPMNHSPQ